MKTIHQLSFILVSTMILFSTSCKKDDAETTPAPTPTPAPANTTCNYTTNVLVIDGTVKTILSDSCRVFGTNYYTEHFADAAKTEGIAIIFDGTALPAAGTYSAVNTFAAVAPGKAYVEYYNISNAYQPASGTVTVTDNGSSKIYTFCTFSCTDGTTTKVISLRSKCN